MIYLIRWETKQQWSITNFRFPDSYLIFLFLIICNHRMFLDSIQVELSLNLLKFQGTTDEIVKWPGPGLSLQQPFFSFLPSANTQNDQSASTISNSNGIVESLDLNLKLWTPTYFICSHGLVIFLVCNIHYDVFMIQIKTRDESLM